MTITHHQPLILASGSAIRQQMLKSVGLRFSVVTSGVDEEALSASLAHLPIPEQAMALAEAKALAVSKTSPDALVIGADQMCEIDGEVLGKPGSIARAQEQLQRLSGRTHVQHCGLALARGQEVIWRLHASATLTMRPLSEHEINAYITADAPLASCGSYKFESLGRHLFAAVDGDHDVIKGLPLTQLISHLHHLSAIALA